jgi:hypothetical protein
MIKDYSKLRYLFCFILISWGASQVQLFSFQWIWRLPKIEDSMERWSDSPFRLWPTHISEKGRTLGKTYEIKSSCYWEHPWGARWEPREHIENLMGTHWELERNMLRTCWEQRKNEKNPPPQPRHLKLKREKIKALWVHAAPSHWLCMKFLFTKPFLTIFSPSPFLTWANTPIINWGYLCILFN